MLKRLLLGLSLVVAFFAGNLVTKAPSLAQGNPNPNEETIRCIGQSLAQYMNAVVNGVNSSGIGGEIRLLSPAFNMTSAYEPGIYNAMVANGAQFGSLWGFSGNVYTIDGKGAYQWYVDNGWEAAAGGKPVVFTEFGDFGARPGVVTAMTAEFANAASRPNVAGIVYFNALNTNPDWAVHALSAEQLATITASNRNKGGANSAIGVNGGGFVNQVESAVGDLGWTVEIINSEGDLPTAAASVRAAHAAGLRPVLRLCVGNSCGFSDPQVLVSFLERLAAAVEGEVYVIAGPNEPATEGWASPNCDNIVPLRDYEYLFRVACGQIRQDNQEFHSLRPYPTNPCNLAVDQKTYLCSNDMVTRETFNVTPTSPGVVGCSGSPEGGQTCNYSIRSTISQIADFTNTQLPIAGNTELVPNVRGPQNLLTFAHRMNEYVSWYLNGVTYRAEEDLYDNLTNTQVLDHVINFSGPLKKLIPIFIQSDRRETQRENIGAIRHNQIVACTVVDLLGLDPFDRLSCYNSGFPETAYHIEGTPFFGVPERVLAPPSMGNFAELIDNPLHKFIPMSSTEDRLGEAKVVQRPPNLEINGVKTTVQSFQEVIPAGAEVPYTRDKLYFPHMEENVELVDLLQSTYKPDGVGDHGGPKPEFNIDQTPYCELIESRTNAGDDIYGEFDDLNNVFTKQNQNPVTVNIDYVAEFTCEFAPVVPTVDPVTGIAVFPTPTCKKDAYVTTKLVSSVPMVDDLWEKAVNGTQSVFRKMFPKVGVNSPVTQVLDIPAKSTASYTSLKVSGDANSSVTALAGNPLSSRSGSSAEVFFPHLGGVKDYFLEGIQKALRPQGSTFASQPGEISCNIENAGVNSPVLRDMIAQAANWASVPVDMLIATLRTEGCQRGTTGVCALSDSEVLQYSEPGAEYPYNCPGGGSEADIPSGFVSKGPFQFYHRANDEWAVWKNAVNMATGENREPNICNIKDSLYAAAYALSAGYPSCPQRNYDISRTAPASSWTMEDRRRVISYWASGCTQGPCEHWAAQIYCGIVDELNGGSGVVTSCNQ